MLVFALAVTVGGVAGITFKTQQLADAFVGIDAAIGTGAVADSRVRCPSILASAGMVFTMKPKRA